ncbi:Plipastatin synthase subunit A [Kordia antarctica]|uniref:Plipastatin synthase subunit A n=1 Tax=Kordia antarctica TaxID=1218801 RepID=A0A7L4ZFZ4_9FLAO|nr:MupA/Atu3671 family FMN-dependent luciferase-like monooxygenase [Kordia antarctica]QHI35410.1 Plipastatin synthase subunit A [Kordia antarctica]
MNINLIDRLLANGVKLTIDEGNLKINAPKGVMTAALLAEIKENKEFLITFLSTDNKIPKVELKEKYPVTSTQRNLWITSQYFGAKTIYNLCKALELEGAIEPDKFELAVAYVIKRHESLRTKFEEDSLGIVHQIVVPFEETETVFSFEDLSDTNDEDEKQTIKSFNNYIFDLTKPGLFRVKLLKKSASTYIFLFNLHHIICDGWSMEVLSREIVMAYNSLLQGQEITLPELRIQYKDYATWKQGNVSEASKTYWVDRYKDELPVLELPFSNTRPKIKTYNAKAISYEFSSEFGEALHKITAQYELTTFMGLMAGINCLFYRYTNNPDSILGTSSAGRQHADLENQIGLFLNIMAIRTSFSKEDSFADFLKIQKKTLLDAYSHQNFGLESLLDTITIKRDASRTPLFDVFVVLQNQRGVVSQKNQDLSDIKVRPKKQDIVATEYDLSFSFTENEEKMFRVALEYNTDLYAHEVANNLLMHLEYFIINASKTPEASISKINYIPDAEKSLLLKDFNNTAVSYDTNSMLTSIEKAVENSPNQIAVNDDISKITYAELASQSDQLAQHLLANGIKKGAVVILSLPKSVELIVGIIGIMKAGATYLPLDPSYPIKRLDYVIEDSGADFILTNNAVKGFLKTTTNIICFEDLQLISSQEVNLPTIESTQTAYIIYTSGTTGNPKGVTITHQNLANFFLGLDTKFGIATQLETWLSVTSMSFDISILEMLWTLTRSSTVILQQSRSVAINKAKKIDFGLLYFASQDVITEENKYNLLLQGATYADENDFKSIWVPERHFNNFGDQFPNPAIVAAVVASTTKNITIRSGSVVLPLHDPVMIAEDWSMVDNISNGRIEISIASGWHPNDFILAPDAYAERHKVMRDHLDVLKKLWSGESITRKNGVGEDFNFKIHPKPIQENLKIWITASRSIDTFIYAGSIGANVLTRLLGQNVDEITLKIKAYRESLEKHGYDPEKGKVAIMLHTFISDDLEYVKNTVKEPFKKYLAHSIELMRPIVKELNLDMEKDFDLIVDMAFHRFYETSCLFGTPESCYDRVKQLHDIGVDEIACLLDFGIDTNIVIDNLQHLKTLKTIFERNYHQYQFLQEETNKASGIDLIEKYEVTHLQSTPSYIQELIQTEEGKSALQKINTLLIGGEALPVHLANSVLDLRKKSIFNMYGPTETTIWSTIKEITKTDEVTIGKPIANTQVYILDAQKELCAIGIIGELYIGGDGVSAGYLNRKELTDERFIQNPFNSNDEKIYKTGDLAKWLFNGELECLGRIDGQVKLRGHRIELGEIEKTLQTKETITDAVVDIIINDAGEKELVAYIISPEKEGIEHLRNHVSKYLPQYMIPSQYKYVQEFPKTPNGKLDRKALSFIQGASVRTTVAYVAPTNDVETSLVKIWQNILQKDKIGIYDNYFDLGGDSLKAVRISSEIQREFDIRIEVTKLFSEPNIAELAIEVTNHLKQKEIIPHDEVADRVII